MTPPSDLIPRFWDRHWRAILILVALGTVLILALTQPHRLVEGVYTLHLVGGCYLDYHIPIQAVTLACPGVDYIRLWPVVQPWWETPDAFPERLLGGVPGEQTLLQVAVLFCGCNTTS